MRVEARVVQERGGAEQPGRDEGVARGLRPAGGRRAPDELAGAGGDPAPGAAAVVVAAWLATAPYALPWYDGLLFALLAMVPASALDGLALARLAVLSLGYLPARPAGRA